MITKFSIYWQKHKILINVVAFLLISFVAGFIAIEPINFHKTEDNPSATNIIEELNKLDLSPKSEIPQSLIIYRDKFFKERH